MAAERTCVIGEILENVPELAQDRSGQYVIQHVMENGEMDDRKRFMGTLKSGYKYLKHTESIRNLVIICFVGAATEEQAQTRSHKRIELVRAIPGQEVGCINKPATSTEDCDGVPDAARSAVNRHIDTEEALDLHTLGRRRKKGRSELLHRQDDAVTTRRFRF